MAGALPLPAQSGAEQTGGVLIGKGIMSPIAYGVGTRSNQGGTCDSPRVAVVELGIDGLDVDDGGVETRPVVEEQVGGGDARRGGAVRHHAQKVLHQVLLHRHQRLRDLSARAGRTKIAKRLHDSASWEPLFARGREFTQPLTLDMIMLCDCYNISRSPSVRPCRCMAVLSLANWNTIMRTAAAEREE